MRARISSAVPAEIAERLSDQADRITKHDLADAREDLLEQLVAGKSVGGINARDIFDDAMQHSGHAGYHGIINILDNVLALDSKGGDELILAARELQKEAQGFIERHLDENEDLIHERAEELAQERDE